MRTSVAFMIAVASFVFVASAASAVTPLQCYTECMKGPTGPGVDRFCRIFCKRQFGSGSAAVKTKGATGGAPPSSTLKSGQSVGPQGAAPAVRRRGKAY